MADYRREGREQLPLPPDLPYVANVWGPALNVWPVGAESVQQFLDAEGCYVMPEMRQFTATTIDWSKI